MVAVSLAVSMWRVRVAFAMGVGMVTSCGVPLRVSSSRPMGSAARRSWRSWAGNGGVGAFDFVGEEGGHGARWRRPTKTIIIIAAMSAVPRDLRGNDE